MSDDIVLAGDQRIAGDYLAQRDQFKNQPHLDSIPPRGCGRARRCWIKVSAAAPACRSRASWRSAASRSAGWISRRRRSASLASTCRRPPSLCGDMCAIQPGEYAVDAVVSLVYAIFHTPREAHAGILRALAS